MMNNQIKKMIVQIYIQNVYRHHSKATNKNIYKQKSIIGARLRSMGSRLITQSYFYIIHLHLRNNILTSFKTRLDYKANSM